MRISRFLHNRRVTAREIVETAAARACAQVAGRHVLAIQDTISVRVDERGFGLSAHPLIAVDAVSGFPLGLVDLIYLDRRGLERAPHKERRFEDKESRRWLDGAQSAARLRQAGAACVTVVEDREGDIYECFAFKPAGVEKVVRASQDRLLADGSRLFAADAWAEAGRMTIALPAIPGRKARQAVFPLRFGQVAISRPKDGNGRERLPESLVVNLVEAREIDRPEGEEPAHWRLLTTHDVNDVADARRSVGFYRLRRTIEQLFRTTKTKGFDIESLR